MHRSFNLASRRRIGFALILLGAGAVGAQSPGGTPMTVIVTLTDATLYVPSELAPGLVIFRVTNASDETHGFEIGGTDIEIGFARPLAPGETRDLRVSLRSGRYHVYCPSDRHHHPAASLAVRYAEDIR